MKDDLDMRPVTEERFSELYKMAKYLQARGQATILRGEYWEGMVIHQDIIVRGQRIARMSQSTTRFYYGEKLKEGL